MISEISWLEQIGQKTFIKYFLVGILAFIVDTTLFIILRNIYGLSISRSNIFAMLVGLIISFGLNHSWVFSKEFKRSKSILRFCVFFINNILVLTTSTWIMVGLVGVTSEFGFNRLREVICKMLVMALVVAWNYTIYSKIIFRHSSKGEIDAAAIY